MDKTVPEEKILSLLLRLLLAFRDSLLLLSAASIARRISHYKRILFMYFLRLSFPLKNNYRQISPFQQNSFLTCGVIICRNICYEKH